MTLFFTPSFVQIIWAVGILTALLSYLPIMLRLEFVEEEKVNPESSCDMFVALNSFEFKCTLVTTICLSFPVVIEIVYDMASSLDTFDNFYLKYLANWFLVFSLIVPDLIYLFQVIPNLDMRLALFVYELRLILTCTSYFAFICSIKNDFWRNKWILTSHIIFTLGCVVQAWHPYTKYNGYLILLSAILQILGMLIFMRNSYLWILMMRKQMREGVEMSVDNYSCTVYAFFSIFVGVAEFCIYAAKNSYFVKDSTTSYVVSTTVIFSLYYIIVPLLSIRAIRREVLLTTNELKVKKMFVRYISHELRTPLNTVMSGLKYLEEDMKRCGEDEDRMSTIIDIKSSCGIAIETLNEMLDYDKIEMGLYRLEKAPQNVSCFMRKALCPFYLQAAEKGIYLSMSSQTANFADLINVFVNIDVNKLSQVIRNLASNAIKFSNTGGFVRAEVAYKPKESLEDDSQNFQDLESSTLENCPPTGYLIVKVVDSGAGISPENCDKLFKGIIQFNPGKLQAGGGTGLGLFISKQIVDLHDGELTAFSEGEGRGCTFTLKLPAWIRSATHVDEFEYQLDNSAYLSITTNDTSSDTVVASDKSGITSCIDEIAGVVLQIMPKVLVVDDVASTRKMVSKLLKSRCRESEGAGDGQDAVNKVCRVLNSEDKFDVVLLDHQMPVMDGPNAAKAMREMGFEGLIIGVTGNVLPEDVTHFMSHGADFVLSKPLDIDEFDRILQSRSQAGRI